MKPKNWNIGNKVTFNVNGFSASGVVTDVFELSLTENIYEVSSEIGVFNLNNFGEPIL